MLDLKFYIPDIRVKLNVLFKHFQQFSKLKLLKRSSFTCAKKISFINPLLRSIYSSLFSHKNLKSGRYNCYLSAAISKQPLNLLTEGIFHPPPRMVHREL